VYIVTGQTKKNYTNAKILLTNKPCMGKKIIFNLMLNLIIIISVIVGAYYFKRQNYLMPLVCAAAFGLTVFYKLKLLRQVKIEMKAKALERSQPGAKKQK
jgi:hypothetical protein